MKVSRNSSKSEHSELMLLLQNGATVDRTDNGAIYVKGSLATAENADATFRSIGNF